MGYTLDSTTTTLNCSTSPGKEVGLRGENSEAISSCIFAEFPTKWTSDLIKRTCVKYHSFGWFWDFVAFRVTHTITNLPSLCTTQKNRPLQLCSGGIYLWITLQRKFKLFLLFETKVQFQFFFFCKNYKCIATKYVGTFHCEITN